MAGYWISLFYACHQFQAGEMGGASILQWRTPDGGSYLEQPAILLQAFRVIREEIQRELNNRVEATHGR